MILIQFDLSNIRFEIETATRTHTQKNYCQKFITKIYILGHAISILISSYHKLDQSLTSPAKVKRYYLIVRREGRV